MCFLFIVSVVISAISGPHKKKYGYNVSQVGDWPGDQTNDVMPVYEEEHGPKECFTSLAKATESVSSFFFL